MDEERNPHIPNLQVWRPADGNETSAAYYQSIITRTSPSVIALTRQNLPQLEGSSIEKASKGGYTLIGYENPDIILVATGSEVSLAVDTSKALSENGRKIGVVSLPDWFTFDKQPKDYRLSVLPDNVPILSIEVMTTIGWDRYSHEQFGINTFGKSGPAKEVYDFFEFNVEGVSKRAEKIIEGYKGVSLKSPLNKVLLS